jgi:HD-GYP domain-containing protein (c-di-GMP phosphodiesterase class II)
LNKHPRPEDHFDFRDSPKESVSYFESGSMELMEEVLDLEDLDEDEMIIFPWSLFPQRDRHEETSYLLENQWIRTSIDRLKNSPIPSCLIDIDLKILWSNLEFIKDLVFDKSSINKHLPEIFRSDSDINLSATLKINLENPLNSYSWTGRLFPFGEAKSNSFLRAMIQPLHYDEASQPLAYMVQWDIITNEYKDLLQKTFLSLLEASKLKDNDTGDHIERVNDYSRLLCEHLKGRSGYEVVNNDYIEDIGFLAAMHDVGKIGTPDDILNKVGPLDGWEREIMNEHTKNGAYILSTYPKAMAKDIALSHHEKWDGSGYPYGIFGEMIPLCARIVCIADVYDALRSKRSYKESFSHKKSVSIMKKGRETHFDPELLDLFLAIHDDFDAIFSNRQD